MGGCGAKLCENWSGSWSKMFPASSGNRAAACQNFSGSRELGAPLRRQVWDRAGDSKGDTGAEKEAAKVEIPDT